MSHRRLRTASLVTLALSLAIGCTESGSRPRRPGDGGSDPGRDARVVEGCDASMDRDGDGIADLAEGTADSDGDGRGNHEDDDSDGDGLSDRDEHGDANPCARWDSDDDGVPDWNDLDSDNDGLSDAEERDTFFTDPTERDSDGDGVTDLGEARGTMTDPNDASSTIPPGDFFVVLPYEGDPVDRSLTFGTNIQRADIYFLIDTTSSMQAPIDNVRSSLTRISSELDTRIRDVQMGVGYFEDFPFGRTCALFDLECLLAPGDNYGSPGDLAYSNVQDITRELARVQSALNGLMLGAGNDAPESQIEALYQTATGEGGMWSHGTSRHAIAPRRCDVIPDELGTRRGYPCFRPGALPIVVMVSDVAFHNGASGGAPYANVAPAPHTFAQAASALNGIGARVLGVAVNGGGRADQEAMARQTGTVDGTGRPLVYDAEGGEVSDAIIEGVDALVGGTPQDVTTARENVAGNPNDVDATGFIRAITPVEVRAADGRVVGPQPGVTYARQDETTFYGVVPGMNVDFQVRFHNDFVRPEDTAQIYRAIIVVIGNGVARLDERKVYIVVPPEDGIVLL